MSSHTMLRPAELEPGMIFSYVPYNNALSCDTWLCIANDKTRIFYMNYSYTPNSFFRQDGIEINYFFIANAQYPLCIHIGL